MHVQRGSVTSAAQSLTYSRVSSEAVVLRTGVYQGRKVEQKVGANC